MLVEGKVARKNLSRARYVKAPSSLFFNCMLQRRPTIEYYDFHFVMQSMFDWLDKWQTLAYGNDSNETNTDLTAVTHRYFHRLALNFCIKEKSVGDMRVRAGKTAEESPVTQESGETNWSRRFTSVTGKRGTLKLVLSRVM
ncbi:hypothetical protein HAX54_027561 [Datura stramonium]|uniref:Uncharacterized protein n=1 Tax=Datura stramonium TaxID=4076 RepID=A0ABS8V5G5_DATST|nr:hypothetical protein [Datura stramonium]